MTKNQTMPAPAAETAIMRDVCRFIDAACGRELRLDDLAAHAGMSRYHFARRFKTIVGVTPGQYVQASRMQRLKSGLRNAPDISHAVYDAGYGSASGVYERVDSHLGMTPAQYRGGGDGVAISYATLETPAGLMMIGATDRGVCFVQFDETETALLERLQSEYPKATLSPRSDELAPEFAAWCAAIERHMSGAQPHVELPLDVRATGFQLRVWQYLRTIPYGDVRSYAEVAAAIGAPNAARAVGNACAKNVLAIVIPCHRVIRGTGHLGAYRWGLERKRTLLDRERSRRAGTEPV